MNTQTFLKHAEIANETYTTPANYNNSHITYFKTNSYYNKDYNAYNFVKEVAHKYVTCLQTFNSQDPIVSNKEGILEMGVTLLAVFEAFLDSDKDTMLGNLELYRELFTEYWGDYLANKYTKDFETLIDLANQLDLDF